MRIQIAITSLALATTPLTAVGPVFPLTENSWDNPEFVERFLGSYGFDMEINPQISAEEGELFKQLAQLGDTNLDLAITTLRQAILPESSAALDYTLGSFVLQQGNIEEAIGHYRRAIQKFPNFFRAYQNMGLALVQNGDYAEALTYLIKAVEIGGGNGSLYGLMGYCYLNTDQKAQSLDAYRMALLLEPNSNDWRMGKLQALMDIGEWQEVIAMLDDVIKQEPERTQYWQLQANAFIKQNQTLEAAANLEIARRLTGVDTASLTLLGDIYLNEGLSNLAKNAYEEALGTDSLQLAKALNLAEAMEIRAPVEETIDFVSNVRDRFEGDLTPDQEIDLLNLEARLALKSGDESGAAEILEEIVSRDPLNGMALLTLGRYYQQEGDAERAEFQFQAAREVDEVRMSALHALARLKVQQRKFREALDYLREAQTIERLPFVADYINQLEASIASFSN